MAKLKGPLHAEQAKGSIEGVTYTGWRGLSVAKRKARPVRRMRRVQPSNRSLLAFLARYWGDLTDDQRQEWRDYGANHPRPDGFGGTFQMTGHQAFISLNHERLRLYGGAIAVLTNPPTTDPVASIAEVVCSDGPASGEIVVGWSHYGTGDPADRCEVWVTRGYASPGRVEVHTQYRSEASVPGGVQTYTITGLIPEMWYWVRVRYVDQYGQVTAWVVDQWQAPKV